MKTTYKHLTDWERWQIYTYLREDKEQKYIAKQLWRNPGTITREIRRNSRSGRYEPVFAQRRYEIRKSEVNKWRSKLKNNPERLGEIREYMKTEKWSPDVIAWRKKKDKKPFVCKQTIYKHIYEQEPSLKELLKYKKWYKKKKTKKEKPISQKPVNKRSIHDRDPSIEERSSIWHREIDTIHSSWSERKWGLLTFIERYSRYTEIQKLQRRSGSETCKAMLKIARKCPKEKLLTITSDNGKEFSESDIIEKRTWAIWYHADTYCSNQRWTNEQNNGNLRVWFPDWTDFTKLTNKDVRTVQNLLNMKPRKILWYRCPYEVFNWISIDI